MDKQSIFSQIEIEEIRKKVLNEVDEINKSFRIQIISHDERLKKIDDIYIILNELNDNIKALLQFARKEKIFEENIK